MNQGFYFVGEGGDGTGKTTQVELLAEYLRKEFSTDVLVLHEPGGAPISDELRRIIKDSKCERSAITNLLLFTASRYESWQKLCLPTLAKGGIVLSARNYLSSLAYQGVAEGLGVDYVKQVTAAFMDQRYMKPDLTVLFTVDEGERKKRLHSRGNDSKLDTFESREDDYHKLTNQAYAQLAETEDLTVMDASRPADKVQRSLRQLVVKRMVAKGLS